MGMSWNITNNNLVANDTCITLYNTPLRCKAVSTTGPVTTGLLSSNRL